MNQTFKENFTENNNTLITYTQMYIYNTNLTYLALVYYLLTPKSYFRISTKRNIQPKQPITQKQTPKLLPSKKPKPPTTPTFNHYNLNTQQPTTPPVATFRNWTTLKAAFLDNNRDGEPAG